MAWYDPIFAIIGLTKPRKPTDAQWDAALSAPVGKIEEMCLDLVDVSTSHRGLCQELDGVPTHAHRGDGSYGPVEPIAHASDHITGGADPIAAATTISAGLCLPIETTLTDDDTKIPTGGAVSDALTTLAASKLSASGAENGKLYIGKANGTFALVNLTQGANVTITNADGSITIATLGRVPCSSIAGTTQAAAVNAGYIPLNAALTTITLPTTAAVGDVVAITGYGAGLWKLAQNASQLIHFLSLVTTTGTGGYIQATTRYDAITVRCVVADTIWIVENAVGNLDVI